jgi:uncharacterized protein YndB with AHSA1/START domain
MNALQGTRKNGQIVGPLKRVLIGCQVFERPRTKYPAAPIAARDDAIPWDIKSPRSDPTPQQAEGVGMSNIHLMYDYPHSPEKLWRILTEPAFMERWALNGRPEGFSPVVGTQFRLLGKPQMGWSGVIDCEVLDARAPTILRYSWVADGGDVLQLTYELEPYQGGTRFTFDQKGFRGIGGFFLAKIVMTPIRKEMFGKRVPALLTELDESKFPAAAATSK